MSAAIRIHELSHRYGARRALADLTLQIQQGEVFVFLGPNGGGKTTLFRVLSTLVPPQAGQVTILGCDIASQPFLVRRKMGIVFQAPSLDKKLTVAENMFQQGALYGMSPAEIRQRSAELLSSLGLEERRRELAETLSGGLRRRVELAKSMLHRPALLLLDEPSTGLDPAARSDLWRYLFRLREQDGVTVVLTSHLLEEADRADRIAILNQGLLVALDTPSALRASVGGDSLTIQSHAPAELAAEIQMKLQLVAEIVDGQVRLEHPQAHHLLTRIVEAFPQLVQSITLGKPTLEDVFITKTGHRFWAERAAEEVSVG